ncbi:hypothetical protein, partial [Pseudomonas sp. MWU12-2115]|uniref:hypothetical protein n=1 Tax=Pseudomonas sp. MWU12-2115 TaxID=2071713 RepID=UPI001C49C93C
IWRNRNPAIPDGESACHAALRRSRSRFWFFWHGNILRDERWRKHRVLDLSSGVSAFRGGA